MSDSIFDLKATRTDATEMDFKDHEGTVMLVVNTASKCGFTPQYKGLESLYKTYKDKGLVVIGFPCDQFAHQEPADDAAIARFCTLNFGVTFPLMAKVKVNGAEAHPVFKLLKKKAPGAIGEAIKWNFTKFLVSKDGRTVRRYAPTVEPAEIEADIVAALQV